MTHMKSLGHNNGLMDEERALSLEESLAYDGTRVLLEAFNLIIQSQINFSKALESEAPVVVSTVNLTKNHIDPTCPTLKPFKFGEVIANHLKITSTTGITGNIEFHSTGLRKNYSIEVFEITNNGLFEKIALWSDISGLKVLQPNRYRIGGEPTPTNQTLTYTITSILEDPFLMAKPEKKGVVLRGNDRFEGYVKDLIDLLAHMVGFEYTIHLVNDSRYGGYYGSNITDGRWNGMIGELIRHEVHMAIAPLTITHQRMSVVDFSHPFMTSGISMMFKKPNITPQDMFPFVRPLSKEVWAAVALAVVIVSFIFYIVSKLSYDYDIHDNSTDNNTTTVSLCSSLSYSIGVLVYQVSGVYPHSISSRIVSVVWWLFVFTIVSTYLANLTSNSVLNKMKFTLYHISGKYESISDGFLYYDQMPVPIASVDDLADQNVIDFGFLRNSATESYFKKSKLSIIWKMWKKVDEKSDQLLVNSYREGIQRVRDSDGQYVFLLESPVNDYINDRQPCNTYRVGKDINIVEYGVALPKGSPIRDKINEAIIQLKENGDLKKLQNHWWRDRSQCKYVDIKDLSNSNITFDNIIIGLIVLSAGLVLAFFVSIVEHFCNRKISYKTRQSNYTISKQEEREENIEDIEDKNSAKRRIIKN
ncbi:glutamate receptor 1-like [Oppia nitens]|uniref:glutamate receptor 1-like n=1 Tax=Oppia nitens TaxID=1686743 RepID=UPI0023DC53C1|nr:glutamate receptor 1-like [Oppia nitens]